MREEHDVPLAPRTTLRLGGSAATFVRCETEAALVDTVRQADAAGTPVFVLGGGSNVVVADEGFAGVVAHVATTGIDARVVEDRAHVEVAAGVNWDDFVAQAVEEGWAGVECLSGIPGQVGGTPIQNVGAYGQDVSRTLSFVRVFDRRRRAVVTLAPGSCGFAYRTSAFKTDPICPTVLSVGFVLERRWTSGPLVYEELRKALDAPPGEGRPLHDVRRTVVELRLRKGMVLDPTDPDTVSAGSFFTNPILDHDGFAAFEARVREVLGPGVTAPRFDEDGKIKIAAAWLIERAGFSKGHTVGAFRISRKHALAIVHTGGGTTRELLAFEETIRAAVRERFGISLQREPVLIPPRPTC